jgi:NADH-quinone oxidoreductase subunit C
MPETSADRPELRRVLEALRERFADAVLAGDAGGGEVSVRLRRDALVPALRFLKEGAGFNALEDLVVFDNLRAPVESGRRFTLVYRLSRSPGAFRCRVEVEAGEGEALPSAAGVYRSADWPEREAYDMFGVHFDGHPDLRRIYMPDDFEGHPLRKDFPLAGRDGGL